MKIRGIPLDTLVKAKLLPQLPVLAEGWAAKNGNDPIERAKQTRIAYQALWLAVGILATVNLLLVLFQFVELRNDLPILICALFAFLAILLGIAGCVNCVHSYISTSAFTKTVNRLDDLLKMVCGQENGICDIRLNTIYHSESVRQRDAVLRFLKECLQIQICNLVRKLAEVEKSQDEPTWLKEMRADYKEFAKLCGDLNMNLGEHGPYFDEAEKRLAQEKAAKEAGDKNLAETVLFKCAGT